MYQLLKDQLIEQITERIFRRLKGNLETKIEEGVSEAEIDEYIDGLEYPILKINFKQRCEDDPVQFVTNELSENLLMRGIKGTATGWRFDTHFPFDVPVFKRDELKEQQNLFELVKPGLYKKLDVYETLFLNNHHIFFRTVLFGDPASEKGARIVKERRDEIFGLIKYFTEELNSTLKELEANDKNLLRDQFLS